MDIDIDYELDAVARRVEQTDQQAAAHLDRVGPVTGQAANGAVSVEVRPGGQLSAVHLTPAALSGGAEALAAQIMALAAQATRRAGAAMHQALAPVLGPDGERHLASLGYEPLDNDSPDIEDTVYESPLGPPPRRPRR
ncbi:YbaB/EbfC family nucleoid-associated protein [Actinokineospora terrae]|uniref:YbaB/EbfC DNA-binding family protein n=1 Tax=Actinokineospora terrae TaxID=155974 RepID=A0A1H9SAP5_9PSEU|nr:YbaB/EbfC family nucleoid-associated protein [Actinokineospora terrae]SER81443.1 YbaB/EbfC DNA-binding family protein [Actinokineospora terrae]